MFSVEAILEYLRTSESMECKVLRQSQDNATLSGFAALSQATESDVSFWVGRVESVTHANGPSNDELLKVRAGLLFVPMFLAGMVLMIKKPDLLRKRLELDEKEKKQRKVDRSSIKLSI